MTLPETIRVKISSEEAGFLSITPVVVREIPVRELVELMLGLTGKEMTRIRELLLRGTLVNGASRFRWEGWDADAGSLETLLATFPDPDPGLPFSPERCVRAVLRGTGLRVDLPREAGVKRRFLRKQSFWDVLIESAQRERLRYVDYSYSDRADLFEMAVSSSLAAFLKESAGLLGYAALGNHLRRGAVESVMLFTRRAPV